MEKQSKEKGDKREKIDTRDVIIPSRPRKSMGEAAMEVLAQKRERQRRADERRKELQEEAEREKRRSRARQEAIMGMRW